MGGLSKAIASTGVFMIILKFLVQNVFFRNWGWLFWLGVVVIFIGVIVHVIEK